MDKIKIINKLVDNVNMEIKKVEKTFATTRALAAHEEMKAESKWDMRKQEASYLAEAHQKRLEELKLELKLLGEIHVRDFSSDDEVEIGAIVLIELNGQQRHYFISSTAGGTLLDIDGAAILVISVFSPIGSEVLGLKIGESFELETPKETRIYTVRKII